MAAAACRPSASHCKILFKVVLSPAYCSAIFNPAHFLLSANRLVCYFRLHSMPAMFHVGVELCNEIGFVLSKGECVKNETVRKSHSEWGDGKKKDSI